MNLQQKALLIVIPLISLLSAGYSYYLYTLKSHQIDQVIEIGEEQLHQQFSHIIEMMINRRYQYDLRKILIQSAIRDSVTRQDREALAQAVDPAWQLLRAENPYVKRMHFHRPDGTSLLRVHLPDKFNDDIAVIRPMLRKMHTDHQPVSAVEMGSHGIFYRVIEPIINEGIYVGAVELGISIDYLMKALGNLVNVESYLLIEQSALKIPDTETKEYPVIGEYIVWASEPKDATGLHSITTIIDSKRHNLIELHGNKSYLLHKELMPTVNGGPQVIMVFAQNLSAHIEERSIFLRSTIFITLAILVIIIITLHKTLTPLLSKLEVAHRALLLKVDEVTAISITDPLTKIFNRGHFNSSFNEEFKKAERYGDIFSIIMFDIDHFKKINDTHGHQEGDEVIVEIVRLVSQNIRESDIFSRWGGDEFIIILPHQSLADGELIAKKLCTSINTHSFNTVDSATISCGVSEVKESDSQTELLQRVDQNLYKAKQAGRNCVFAR